MSKRKNNRLGKAGITFYTYATGSAPFWVGETFFSRR